MIPNDFPSLNFDLGDTADQLRASVLGFTEPHCLPAPLQQMLKLGGVNLVGTHKQAVPGLLGDQRVLRADAG